MPRALAVCPGYRWFACPNCKERWRSNARDCNSNATEICGNCAEPVLPRANHPDPRLQVDANGRLLDRDDPIILSPGMLTKRYLC